MKRYKITNNRSGLEFVIESNAANFHQLQLQPEWGKPEHWTSEATEEEKITALDTRTTDEMQEWLLPAEHTVIVEDMEAELTAKKWTDLRKRRDKLLADTDYTQIADAPFNSEVKQAWRNYRQALRDLPENTYDIDNVSWPQQPE